MSTSVRIVARGVPAVGYYAYGRHFPRDKQIECVVSSAEYAQMVADANMVCVAIPEASEHSGKQKAK